MIGRSTSTIRRELRRNADPVTGRYLPATADKLAAARLKEQVAAARLRATRVVNTELLTLYWDLGSAIVDRQDAEGWGTTVVDRLATDLRAAFPDMRGLSRSNLYSMRKLA